MSLLDDVSIVVTPNAYNARILYGVLPTATEGSELVSCSSFDCADPDAVWNRGGNWTIAGGLATRTSGSTSNISQVISGISGKLLKVSYTVSGYGGDGNIGASPNGSDFNANTGNDTYTDYITPTSDNLYIRASYSFSGSIDNVSVKEFTASDMDVTRETAATRVDENGLVNYAEVLGSEIITNGDFATDSDWTKQTGWSISGGSANYDFTTNSKYLRQTLLSGGFVSGKSYRINFEITDGTAYMNIKSNAETLESTNLYSTGSYSIYVTASANGSDLLIYGVNTQGTAFSIDNVSVKEVDRNNVPRIDYTGGGCPHILSEPQRTNELQYSEDFSQSYWSSTGSPTITTNYGISPSGAKNSVRIQGNNGVAIYNSGGFASDDSRSIFIKATSGSGNIQLLSNNSNTNNVFSIDTNWKRVELNSAPNVSSLYYAVDMRSAETNIYDVEIWGAQLEEGSYATSYIPTSGSSVTRNQDVFTRDGIASLINSTEGVLFVEMAALEDSTNQRWISIGSGSNANRVSVLFNAVSKISCSVRASSSAVYDANFNIGNQTNNSKVAIRYKNSDFAFFVNGVKVNSQLSGTISFSSPLNKISFDSADTFSKFFGKVKQVQVYKTALTDAQLISLTT